MVKFYKIDNVNGSEDNISLITPFNPDEKDNFWVDDHPETKNFTIGYFLTDSELAARDAEIWEAAREETIDRMGYLDSSEWSKEYTYDSLEQYQASKQQEGEKI